jgi:hypothetical protein
VPPQALLLLLPLLLCFVLFCCCCHCCHICIILCCVLIGRPWHRISIIFEGGTLNRVYTINEHMNRNQLIAALNMLHGCRRVLLLLYNRCWHQPSSSANVIAACTYIFCFALVICSFCRDLRFFPFFPPLPRFTFLRFRISFTRKVSF